MFHSQLTDSELILDFLSFADRNEKFADHENESVSYHASHHHNPHTLLPRWAHKLKLTEYDVLQIITNFFSFLKQFHACVLFLDQIHHTLGPWCLTVLHSHLQSP